jgi:formylglycine-generating enzyme required for sulfatase activity
MRRMRRISSAALTMAVWGAGWGAGAARVPEPEMVHIQGGCFQMGSPESEAGRWSDEPLHRVCVGDFDIGKYEVSFDEYDRFCRATGREEADDSGWGRGRRPVINVSWSDAMAYAGWLSGQTGKRYRLPTEAEWEYAARGGTKTAYWWGNEIGSNRANCNGCGSQWDGKRTAPVGSFRANPFGLHDTVGNVWEWTCSVYDEGYRGGEKVCAGAGEKRVYRGGAWGIRPRDVRAAFRDWAAPDYGTRSIGFRLARER